MRRVGNGVGVGKRMGRTREREGVVLDLYRFKPIHKHNQSTCSVNCINQDGGGKEGGGKRRGAGGRDG